MKKLIPKLKKGVDTAKKGSSSNNWIQKAVNPAHKGFCTPMTKATCTPHRKALARTFKNMAKQRKHENGGLIDFLQPLITAFKNGGYIQKLQNGNAFWGINNSEYTPEYNQNVNDILSNPDKMQAAFDYMKQNKINYALTKAGFQQAAFDKNVGPVHKYIYSFKKPQFKDVSTLEGFIRGKKYSGTEEDLINKVGPDFRKQADKSGYFESVEPKYVDLQTNDTIPHLEMWNRLANRIRVHKKGGSIEFLQPLIKQFKNLRS